MEELEWIEVLDNKKPIGAVGFVGNRAVAVTAYFHDADVTQDGLSALEWVMQTIGVSTLKGDAVANVAETAAKESEIFRRDHSFQKWALQLRMRMLNSMAVEGVYGAYFNIPVKKGAKMAARLLVRGKVRRLMVRKGAERIFEDAIKAELSKEKSNKNSAVY